MDGAEALQLISREPFDALVTDWMMPKMDGIELIERVRATIDPPPFIVMVTAIGSTEAKERSLMAGADDYLAKPVSLRDLESVVRNGLGRMATAPVRLPPIAKQTRMVRPSMVGVVIASSTGGPQTLPRALDMITSDSPAAYFIVQHAPGWMLDTFADRLTSETGLQTHLAEVGDAPIPGHLYLAPGDLHLTVGKGSLALHLDDGPRVENVRPAADRLFQSAAAAFGRYCVAVILTGLGQDGTVGAAHVAAAGGVVLAQDPKTAVMPFMPRAAIGVGVAKEVVPLRKMGAVIDRHVRELDMELRSLKAA